jgi:hypothetical protein
MAKVRVVYAGFFERAPEHDVIGAAAWRAFKYVHGGIWYAQDNEDYTICYKERCSPCSGRGIIVDSCPEVNADRACGEYDMGWPCGVCGFGESCALCDGRGYVFVPLTINVG